MSIVFCAVSCEFHVGNSLHESEVSESSFFTAGGEGEVFGFRLNSRQPRFLCLEGTSDSDSLSELQVI